ncbi:hypothetical protein ACWDUB_04955 [Streptomyces fungicidicus]|uniref:hypothetical protein n=1 Tax=Streptomyces fungicidicus TaxID=68203 RepID=UPI0036B8CFC2
MSRDSSADPFSTFLNATNHQVVHGGSSAGPVRSTDALPPVAMLLIRALDGRPRTAVGELRIELGLTTLQIAEAVEVLRRLSLVEVVAGGGDEVLELTSSGQDFVDGTR